MKKEKKLYNIQHQMQKLPDMQKSTQCDPGSGEKPTNRNTTKIHRDDCYQMMNFKQFNNS